MSYYLTKAMPLLELLHDPVSFKEIAAVQATTAARVLGGPPALIGASSRQLAAALKAAGFQIARG